MAARGKIGRLCRALLVAVSMAALSAGVAHAQDAGDLDELNQRILENPQDVGLNLQYAHAAEAAGQLRLALAAYERILINDPANVEARRGYERVRREIEPGYTVVRAELGARWDSNVINANEDLFSFTGDDNEGTTYYVKGLIANEHQFFGRRWRTIANLDVERTPDFDELDYDYLGVQTGPIFYVAPHVAALPAIGASIAYLDGDQYYNEVNVSLTVEGRTNSASYWWRARAGYRDYNPESGFFFTPTITESGNYVELQAGITKPRVFSERDALLLQPFARWSDIDGTIYNFFLGDEVSPGKYLEYGADVNYNYRFTDHIEGSIGALLRQRDFSDSRREDTYISPQASVTFQGMLPCACDVRLQYRYRDSDSNDFTADYTADQVSLALLTRF